MVAQARIVIGTFKKRVPEMPHNVEARRLSCFGGAELENMEEDCTHYAMTKQPNYCLYNIAIRIHKNTTRQMTLNYLKNSW